MGSPKVVKSLKKSIWHRKIGVPFAVGLVVFIVAFVAFSEQFTPGPNELGSGHLSETRSGAPKQEGDGAEEILGIDLTKEDAGVEESPDNEAIKGQKEEKTEKSEPKQAPESGKLADQQSVVEERQTPSPALTKEEENSERSEPSTNASPPRDQEGEGAAKSGHMPHINCVPPPPGLPVCDLSNPRFDICELCGDARMVGRSSTVMYVPQPRPLDGQEWSIRAQSRKHLPWIKKVTVKSLNASQPEPWCTSKHAMPAIVFALGGLTANVWHDFSDVLIPLFLTARQFDGDVQLLITNNQPWFVKKYASIFSRLTRHDIVDFDMDDQVRCYPHVIVGLRSHRDLGINPNYSQQNYSMVDFRLFVREAYGLPAGVDIPYKADKDDPDKKPRVMLVNRSKTRRFMNAKHVSQGLEWFGFDVVTADPKVDSKLDEFVRLVDSCDAIMGVHGAGLTNMVFMRSGGVVVHIVPYGIEFMADGFYGAPARDMGLRHVQYEISVEETTLLEKYGWDHTVIKDPEAIKKSGWEKVGEFYMSKQDIVLNMTRFGPSLLKALEFIM